MANADQTTTEVPSGRQQLRSLLSVLVAVPTLLGAAHHVDHIVRGNHVGWPVTSAVNEFTFSLAIYPLVALGLYLTVTDRAGSGYWAGLLGFSAALLSYLHLSPWAVEPPGDVLGPYAEPAVGYLAFLVLLALIASVTLGAVGAGVLWYRNRTEGA